MKDAAEFLAHLRAERRRRRETVVRFVESARAGDLGSMGAALSEAGRVGALPGLIRAAGRIDQVPRVTRDHFVWIWAELGDSLRTEAGHDLELIDMLWKFLPPYKGPQLRLFRGEGAINRKRRCYGPSWTSSRAIAEKFAAGRAPLYIGGSVLIETEVPANAIISAVHEVHNDYAEDEYVIDRRLLGSVRLLKRFPPPANGAQGAVESAPVGGQG